MKAEVTEDKVAQNNNKTTTESYDIALENGYPTFLEFKTSNCPACKSMEPIMKEAQTKYNNRANVIVINLDLEENRDLAMAYNIRVVPTLIFLDENAVIKTRFEGMTSIEDIEKMLKEAGMQ